MKTFLALAVPFALSVSLVVAMVSCEAGHVDVGTTDAASGTLTFTAAQVEAARAACSAPHGTVDAYHTPEELVALLARPWFACNPTDGGTLAIPPSFYSGVFSSDGNWNELADDGHGGLVEQAGLVTSGHYIVILLDDASPSCDPAGCILGFEEGGQQGSFGDQFGVGFEENPPRMLVAGTSWFVPLP